VLTILSRSTALAVPLSEAKLALRVDHSDDDDRIESLIRSETGRFEAFCQRRLVRTEIEASFPNFVEPLVLPAEPFREILEVAYLDEAHVRQTVAPEFYYTAQNEAGQTEVRFADSFFAPLYSDRPYPVRVVFVAGLDDILETGADEDFLIEERDKICILQLVAALYDHGKAMTQSDMRATMGDRRVLR
jgi:hypothetical protein